MKKAVSVTSFLLSMKHRCVTLFLPQHFVQQKKLADQLRFAHLRTFSKAQ
jgi:hypothetical protein